MVQCFRISGSLAPQAAVIPNEPPPGSAVGLGFVILGFPTLVGILSSGKGTMQPIDSAQSPGRFSRVLTDVHFWVPFAVLIGGLVLLESIR
jgi:hypothetical protein